MHRRWFVGILFAPLWFAIPTAAQPPAARSTPETEQRLAAAVQQLSSPVYDRRVQATELLLAAGESAVRHLVRAIESDDFDTRIESLKLLRQLYDSPDFAASCRAGDVFQRLTQHRHSMVADFASDVLRSQSALAIDRLQRLGAKFQSSHAIVELGTAWKGDPEDALALRWIEGLQTLRILCPRADDRVLDVLQWLPKLSELVVLDVPIGDAGAAQLRFVPGLRILYLKGTRVTNAGMQFVGQLRSLAYLDISHTQVDDQGLDQLHPLTRLKTLDVRGLELTDAAISRLQAALAKTKILVR